MNRRFFLQVSAAALIACIATDRILAVQVDVQKMLDELSSGKVQRAGPHGEAAQSADGIQLRPIGQESTGLRRFTPLAVTRDNLQESWRLTYHSEPPASLVDALK